MVTYESFMITVNPKLADDLDLKIRHLQPKKPKTQILNPKPRP